MRPLWPWTLRTMSFAPTFGSVGDIISVTILIKDIIKCLKDAQGSKKEYSGTIETLETLEVVVSQVYGQTSELSDDDALRTPATAIAVKIERALNDFKILVAKYQPSLQPGGSGNMAKDAIRKIQWKLADADVKTFRENIQTLLASLNVVQNAKIMYVFLIRRQIYIYC